MITVKKLFGGGDKWLEKAIDNAAVLGVDLIEVLWLTDNGGPRHSVAQIAGFYTPVMGDVSIADEDAIKAGWVDDTLKFYPDAAGRCWGYIYDTPQNRDLICSSFVNGRFRVVDKKIREELFKEAEEKGYKTTPNERAEVLIKVTKREKEAIDKEKATLRKLEELEQREKELREQLAIARGEKVTHIDKRLKGVKIPNREELIEDLKKD